MTAATTFEIGATLGSMATLVSRQAIEPKATFTDYSNIVKLGSGLVKGLGFPQAEWYYEYITQTQYDVFRTFCPTVGASVFIATLTNDMAYVRYTALMEMPTQFVLRSPEGRKVYQDITIKFSNLVEAE